MRIRNIYQVFLLSSCFFFIAYPLAFQNRNKNQFEQIKINNIKGLIDDSIEPSCVPVSKTNYNKSLVSIDNIEVLIPESRRWIKNLINARLSKNKNIINRYKRKFNSYILINTLGGKKCKLAAKVRLSGDWKDHIEFEGKYIVSSMDVKLVEGNVDGIVKFKLFIPSTRNKSSEIITTTFLRSMGYLSPRTRLINVTVNGNKLEMILQEKPSKEMLESNNLRESAIIGSNESLLWKLRASLEGGGFNSNIFPKVINFNWARKGSINKNIILKGMNILSRSILESWNRGEGEYSFSDFLLSNGDEMSESTLSAFRSHLIAMRAHHSLYNHNRRFYYNAFSDSLSPIYYDGNSLIRELQPLTEKRINRLKSRLLLRELTSEDLDRAIEEVKKLKIEDILEKLNLSGVKINYQEILRIKSNLIDNLNKLKKHIDPEKKLKWGKNPLFRIIDPSIEYGLAFGSDGREYTFCNLGNQSCKTKYLNKEESINLLRGDFINKKINYFYLGSDYYDYVRKIDEFNYYNTTDSFINKELINIRKIGDAFVEIDELNKTIMIKTNKPNQKVVLYNSNLIDWNIDVEANTYLPLNNDESRFDNKLLTGLLTIQDSNLKGIQIRIKGGKLEDSLNILRSSGSIDYISVSNSYQDSIDFDFSNLEINEIRVGNAGNDCLDLSSGEYIINSLFANTCNDKGVSAGESSYVNINNAIITNSKLALVAKDSSELIVNNGDLIDFEICVAAYRKKQEYGGSMISIPKGICPKVKSLIQVNSILFEK